MEAQKTLRRPANWQDFEQLCKKLWGEIWECPNEIQKNGRLGQEQFGIDVFGIPKGESEYYGIQCKGKNEYSNAQLTEDEVDTEIEKAKNFEPSLKKMYFATTAQNDSKIQQYIRKKNIEHLKNGLFEVHLYSWESIVDLLEDNIQTYNWYVNNRGYKSSKEISISFHDDVVEKEIFPQFIKKRTEYVQKIVPASNNPYWAILVEPTKRMQSAVSISPLNTTKINYSLIPIKIKISNTGDDTIESYKLYIDLSSQVQEIADSNEKYIGCNILKISDYNKSTLLNRENNSISIIPSKNILVGSDYFFSDSIYIKPYPKDYTITLNWVFISREYRAEGQLTLKVKPIIEPKLITIPIPDPLEVGKVIESEIEDYWAESK